VRELTACASEPAVSTGDHSRLVNLGKLLPRAAINLPVVEQLPGQAVVVIGYDGRSCSPFGVTFAVNSGDHWRPDPSTRLDGRSGVISGQTAYEGLRWQVLIDLRHVRRSLFLAGQRLRVTCSPVTQRMRPRSIALPEPGIWSCRSLTRFSSASTAFFARFRGNHFRDDHILSGNMRSTLSSEGRVRCRRCHASEYGSS